MIPAPSPPNPKILLDLQSASVTTLPITGVTFTRSALALTFNVCASLPLFCVKTKRPYKPWEPPSITLESSC